MSPFQKEHKQTSIFITAGFPELNSLETQIEFLQNKGVDFIEIGIPFSDPLADGPTIQESSAKAIANGMSITELFSQLRRIKPQVKVPLVLMGYLNPVMQFGFEEFLQTCDDLEIKALILPDLSFELYKKRYESIFEKYKVQLCFLITPKTASERIVTIAKQCENSFVYLVSQNSITGNTFEMGSNLKARYSEIRKLCGKTPLFLGFGIDSAEKRKSAFENCDGVIVGTAYLKNLAKNEAEKFLIELMPN
jgi:tryptophan synthase alpha chain